jgi:DNA-directed RNA polymerase subunit RPC12/RpoP
VRRQLFVHFCSQCFRDFRSISEHPDACGKCGSFHWYEMKHYPVAKPPRANDD